MVQVRHGGRTFQVWAAATEKARSPTVTFAQMVSQKRCEMEPQFLLKLI